MNQRSIRVGWVTDASRASTGNVKFRVMYEDKATRKPYEVIYMKERFFQMMRHLVKKSEMFTFFP
jgi:hypothetical protein